MARRKQYSATQANALTDAELRAGPVFRHRPRSLFSSSISPQTRDELLAKAIPAISGAVGEEELRNIADNCDMNKLGHDSYRNGWPRNHNNYGQSWLHGDLKDVAYFYNNNLFDEVVRKGSLE